MALTFSSWTAYTDDDGNAKTLDWSSDSAMTGMLLRPCCEAIRQALLERATALLYSGRNSVTVPLSAGQWDRLNTDLSTTPTTSGELVSLLYYGTGPTSIPWCVLSCYGLDSYWADLSQYGWSTDMEGVSWPTGIGSYQWRPVPASISYTDSVAYSDPYLRRYVRNLRTAINKATDLAVIPVGGVDPYYFYWGTYWFGSGLGSSPAVAQGNFSSSLRLDLATPNQHWVSWYDSNGEPGFKYGINSWWWWWDLPVVKAGIYQPAVKVYIPNMADWGSPYTWVDFLGIGAVPSTFSTIYSEDEMTVDLNWKQKNWVKDIFGIDSSAGSAYPFPTVDGSKYYWGYEGAPSYASGRLTPAMLHFTQQAYPKGFKFVA